MRAKTLSFVLFLMSSKVVNSQDSMAAHVFFGHAAAVNSIDLSPDEKTLVSAGKDGTLRFWDLSAHQQSKTLRLSDASVKRVAYNHGGTAVLAALYARFAEVDVNTFKPRFSKKNAHSAFVETVLYSADDKYILTSSWRDKSLVVWKGPSMKLHLETSEETWVDNAIFNRKNNLIFSGGHDDLVKVWDFETGKMIRSLAGHSDWVYDLCLSPDEKLLYSASFDKTIKVWDVNSGKNIRTLLGHSDGLVCLALSQDGRYLASGGMDKQIIIWDLNDYKMVKKIQAHSAAVTDLHFSADHKTLFSSSQDKTIKVWDLTNLEQ
jgi:WD40 repeat protein